jgi:hypothetical protein
MYHAREHETRLVKGRQNVKKIEALRRPWYKCSTPPNLESGLASWKLAPQSHAVRAGFARHCVCGQGCGGSTMLQNHVRLGMLKCMHTIRDRRLFHTVLCCAVQVLCAVLCAMWSDVQRYAAQLCVMLRCVAC